MSSSLATEENPEVRFQRLYDLHYEPLLAYARRRCRAEDEAQDVVSDAFLVLWRRRGQAPPDGEVPLWLYGVAKRVLSNRHRAAFRAQRVVDRLTQLRRSQTDVPDLVAQLGDVRAVMRSLARLRDDEREIVLLSGWERLTASEIATAIDCTPNAAAIRLHRARKRLTNVFEQERQNC